MFNPEFTAVCDACGQATLWFKANRVVAHEGAVPVAEKGFKCSVCESFEEKVLDTRGRIHDRDA